MKTLNITEISKENERLKKIIENLEKQNKTLLHYILILEKEDFKNEILCTKRIIKRTMESI